MNKFELFSKEHFFYLVSYSLITFLFIILSLKVENKKKFARNSAIIIGILKISELAYRLIVLDEPIRFLLPLHLCNLTLIAAIIAMISGSRFFLNLTYFWSAGTVFALLTPEVRINFPHLLNIIFFLTHFYLIFSAVSCIKTFNFKPTFKNLIKAFKYVNFAFIIIFFINLMLGTNYMFVNYKPSFRSPLDYMGPWPYYIVCLEIITFICFALMYLPFHKKKR
ncbi:TIGR02206 family membrane protein [uncultured Ilyobacter sp.]|uniref:YwaF family protein n=1 Tax=uncultured Ilyobacter sp. TaxID=544433 RepID=UPI0029C909D8|nr:TIGR02206 family membrane protein [uncultured Ilyobacter sp.]